MSCEPSADPLSIGECASLACLLECTAAKPGNVHRGADFDDVSYLDFVLSAQAIRPVFDRAAKCSVGQLVLDAVTATRRFVASNTNLGMILLFAPLAKAPRNEPLEQGVRRVLAALDADDSRLVYEAIRLARPGGLGKVAEADVSDAPPADLRHAMHLAADRDLIARQYDNGFHELFARVVPWLAEGCHRGWSVQTAIIHTHLRLMAEFPDTLIARKCGPAVAEQAAAIASQALASGEPGDDGYQSAVAALDFWLRADGRRRNPGTTADMLAAGLFCLLRDGRLQLPLRFYA